MTAFYRHISALICLTAFIIAGPLSVCACGHVPHAEVGQHHHHHHDHSDDSPDHKNHHGDAETDGTCCHDCHHFSSIILPDAPAYAVRDVAIMDSTEIEAAPSTLALDIFTPPKLS